MGSTVVAEAVILHNIHFFLQEDGFSALAQVIHFSHEFTWSDVRVWLHNGSKNCPLSSGICRRTNLTTDLSTDQGLICIMNVAWLTLIYFVLFIYLFFFQRTGKRMDVGPAPRAARVIPRTGPRAGKSFPLPTRGLPGWPKKKWPTARVRRPGSAWSRAPEKAPPPPRSRLSGPEEATLHLISRSPASLKAADRGRPRELVRIISILESS